MEENERERKNPQIALEISVSCSSNANRFETAEVDRAVDNLVKSGKMFNPPRRDSMPMMPGAVPRFPVEPHGMLPR